MLQQTVAQVNVVAIGIAGGRNALVDLEDVHVGPRNIFVGEVGQHDPRTLAATDGHDETATRSDCGTGIRCNNRSRALGQRSGIRIDFNVHRVFSITDGVVPQVRVPLLGTNLGSR